MTNSIWETVAETPWWVYVVIIYFIHTSLQARKPRLISIKAMLVLPLFLYILSLISLHYFGSLQVNVPRFSLWLTFALMGVALGFLEYHARQIKIAKDKRAFYFAGSWNLLIIFITILIIKFYFAGNLNIDP